jgi:hypothetical protein
MPRVSPKPTCWKAKLPAIIVCFTEARPNHQCRRGVPIDETEVGCIETSNILSLLNFLSRPDASRLSQSLLHIHSRLPRFPESTFSQAVEWYTEYTKSYPDVDHDHVLVAQRERLFSHLLPVYPELYVEFGSDDLYCKAEITRDPLPDEEMEDDFKTATHHPEPVADKLWGMTLRTSLSANSTSLVYVPSA